MTVMHSKKVEICNLDSLLEAVFFMQVLGYGDDLISHNPKVVKKG